MKLLKYMLFLLVGLASCACTEEAGNPAFADDELYIYDQTAATLTTMVGEEFKMSLTVSPNDGSVECCWLLDEQPISYSKDLVYVFTQPGTYSLRFEAVRGGRAISKKYTLTVTERI